MFSRRVRIGINKDMNINSSCIIDNNHVCSRPHIRINVGISSRSQIRISASCSLSSRVSIRSNRDMHIRRYAFNTSC